jgi:hypothetical protein
MELEDLGLILRKSDKALVRSLESASAGLAEE